jgi:hypothetical protein
MYLAVSESTLATRAVNEGRPSEPGAGWITSAPMKYNQEGCRQEAKAMPTHNNRWVARVGQNSHRLRVRDRVDASQFNVDPVAW